MTSSRPQIHLASKISDNSCLDIGPIGDAISRGLDCLDRLVSDEGVWLCHRYRLNAVDDLRVEINPFVGALGSLSLRNLNDERAAEVIKRTLRHILSAMEPQGVWRYWQELPPDADSTSICNIAVGPQLALFGGWYRQRLLNNRNRDGLFQVWLYSGEINDADAVVNANVTACLGDIPETRAAQDWLSQIVAEGVEHEEIHYYWDSIDLYSAIVRAHLRHPSLYVDILPAIAERIQRRRQSDGSYGDGMRTAMAVTTLSMLEAGLNADEANLTAQHLLSLQQDDGGWPESPHSSGPGWPMPREYKVTSPALEAACCIEALTHLAVEPLS